MLRAQVSGAGDPEVLVLLVPCQVQGSSPHFLHHSEFHRQPQRWLCGTQAVPWVLVLTLSSLVWSTVWGAFCLSCRVVEAVRDPSLKVFKETESHRGVCRGGVCVSNCGNVFWLQGQFQAVLCLCRSSTWSSGALGLGRSLWY